MDRIIVYPAEVAQSSTDNLTDSKNAYIAISKLAQIITGTITYINNFPCNPTSPASLSVVVGGGEIYSYQPIDSSAYGGIPADTSNFIMKQGITLSSTTFALTAPTNTGNSKNYLIQISFSEIDNASSQRTFVNSETLQNYTETVSNSRINTCIISTKVGAEAPTGTQLTPSPDANFVGAWVVTVDYGQTQINSDHINLYSNAPFLRTIIDSLPTYAQKLALNNAPNPINAANPVVDLQTLQASSGWSTGDVKLTYKSVADAGWLMLDDGTIGNATSGATHASSATQALFILLWNNVGNAYCPVSGGRGASGLDDFNAGKKLSLAPVLSRVLGVSGHGAGLSSLALGQTSGVENINQNSLQLASHQIPTVMLQYHYPQTGQALTTAGGAFGFDQTLPSVVVGGSAAMTVVQPTASFNAMIKL